MKNKLFLCVCALTATIVSFAQDVIITTDAQKIEAKIMEVSKSEIKYKELNNLDGPLFTLATSDINTIIYANGKVVLYNQPTQSTQQPIQQESEQVSVEQSASIKRQAFSEPEKKQTNEFIATILLRSGHVIEGEIIAMNNRHVEYYANGSRNTIPASQIESVTLPNGQIKTYNAAASETSSSVTSTVVTSTTTPTIQKSSANYTSGRIYRDNGHFLYNDTYISSKEVARILERENSAAYEQWKKAGGMTIGGAVCTGIGGGLVLGGLFSLISGDAMPCLIMECTALVPLGVGLGLTLGASSKYNRAIDIYNSKYDHAAVQLRWSVAPNGVGLALAF